MDMTHNHRVLSLGEGNNNATIEPSKEELHNKYTVQVFLVPVHGIMSPSNELWCTEQHAKILSGRAEQRTNCVSGISATTNHLQGPVLTAA